MGYGALNHICFGLCYNALDNGDLIYKLHWQKKNQKEKDNKNNREHVKEENQYWRNKILKVSHTPIIFILDK